MVVRTSACPSSSWTVRMSYPACSRWVVNEWRSTCGEQGLSIPEPRAAAYTARCTDCSCRWYRKISPDLGSVDLKVPTKNHCHPQAVAAAGYLVARESGSQTLPNPSA